MWYLVNDFKGEVCGGLESVRVTDARLADAHLPQL